MPVRVSVPAATVTSPEPPITPLKVVEALLRVRVWPPRLTIPFPVNVTMEAPAVVPEMSKKPLSVTTLELAMPPVPVR